MESNTIQQAVEGTDNALIVRTFKTEDHNHSIDVIEYIYQIPAGGPFGWMCGDCNAEGEGFRSIQDAEIDANETHQGDD